MSPWQLAFSSFHLKPSCEGSIGRRVSDEWQFSGWLTVDATALQTERQSNGKLFLVEIGAIAFQFFFFNYLVNLYFFKIQPKFLLLKVKVRPHVLRVRKLGKKIVKAVNENKGNFSIKINIIEKEISQEIKNFKKCQKLNSSLKLHLHFEFMILICFTIWEHNNNNNNSTALVFEYH